MTDTLGDRIRARRAVMQQYASSAQTAAQSYTDQAMNALLEASQQWVQDQPEEATLGDTPQTVAEAIASSVTAYVDTQVAAAITQTNAYTDSAIAKLVADNNLQP